VHVILQKPFAPSDLLKAIQGALAGAGAEGPAPL